jgi:ABC-2 type transport system ATP-binding protein
VLLSSHLLREVEVIADDIVMIGHGEIVSQGSKTELLKAGGSLVRTPEGDTLEQALAAAGADTDRSGDGALRTSADPSLVGRIALAAGVALTELRTADGGLEDMFLELTADTQREGRAA